MAATTSGRISDPVKRRERAGRVDKRTNAQFLDHVSPRRRFLGHGLVIAAEKTHARHSRQAVKNVRRLVSSRLIASLRRSC